MEDYDADLYETRPNTKLENYARIEKISFGGKCIENIYTKCTWEYLYKIEF